MIRKRKRKALRVYSEYQNRPVIYIMIGGFLWMSISCFSSLILTMVYPTSGQYSLLHVHGLATILALIETVMLGFSIHRRLATHEEAIEFNTIFKRIIIPWEDLSHLEVIKSSNSGWSTSYTYYLCLKHNSRNRFDISSIVPIKHIHHEIGYFIDIEHLLSTSFGQDLLRYAPHVIEAAHEAENRAKAP